MVLKNLKSQDIEEPGGLLWQVFSWTEKCDSVCREIPAGTGSKPLQKYDTEWLLENFFEEPLLGKQEQKLLRQQEKERIWENFRKSYEGMPIETVEESLENVCQRQ